MKFMQLKINIRKKHKTFYFFKASLFTTQSLKCTSIDKIFAICDYKIENMIGQDTRHLYDIAKIIYLYLV